MHTAAQYLEVLVVVGLVSLGLGLAAAWGIIRVMFGLLDAARVEGGNQHAPTNASLGRVVGRESLEHTT
jgi:hypothetical protein